MVEHTPALHPPLAVHFAQADAWGMGLKDSACPLNRAYKVRGGVGEGWAPSPARRLYIGLTIVQPAQHIRYRT